MSTLNFANVITTEPGETIASAFNKINENFANIASVGSNVIIGVTTVAGRTGNVVLSVNDIVGAASTVYAHSYTMGNSANWSGDVSTIGQALDQLALRLKNAGF